MAAQRAPLRVVGRYAVYNEIAAGGMATVHIGRLLGPVGFARTVAIKRLHPQFAKDPEFVSMFLDEARLAARVQHPNVVATIDVVATGGELFLIMDYVRGESLSRLIRAVKRDGQLVPPRIGAAIMCGFLHGLHAAHEAKNERGETIDLVHRDVSPQNVLVGADGITRVLDFGIAKAQGRIQVTRDGQIKGKLAYMPPEQLAGRELTRAVDVYASAVVTWEMLTGERLFKGETESDTLAKILRDEVLPPSLVVPSVPASFDAVLLRALSREPSMRHATARQLALELERCVGVASPTEVGEWVEGIVGPVLSAREHQIAEIESSSAPLGLSPSGRPVAEPASDTDLSFRPRNAYDIGGAPQSGLVAAARRVPSSEAVTEVMGAAPGSREDGTGTEPSRATGSLSLPIDRKLPIFATALGMLVFLVIVAVVVLGGGSESSAPAKTASPAQATATPTSSPTTPPTLLVEEDVPLPPPTTGAEPAGVPEASSRGAPPRPAPAASAQKPVARPAGPSAPARANCDPPYTIDAQGHRRYKLECM